MKNQITTIYDNENATFDRYTFCFKDTNMVLGLSANCDSPQGFSQWGECKEGPHLGKQILFVDLPRNVRDHATKRLS